MAGTFSTWSPYTTYVQGGMVDGAYAQGAFTLIAAGPPRLANIGGAAAISTAASGAGTGADQVVLPIGLIQNFGLSHTRQFSRIYEIGSERSYFIGGRTMGQLQLSRVYYHGASLLRMLYAYYQDALPPTVVNAMWSNAGAAAQSNPHDVIIPPGYENIFINLASDLFAQPVGMMMYMRDVNQETLGAVYFEACYVPNHSWQTDSNGVLIQESVAVQFERAVPVGVAALQLINSANPNDTGANIADAYLPSAEVNAAAPLFRV